MTLAEVHNEIRYHCGEICDLFKSGAKVTVLVRNPGRGEQGPHSADMLVSDDDLDEVIKSLEYLKAREVTP